MTEQQARWPGFNYEPVGAITTRLLARYLRTQRKNMLRFFQERGLYTLADRMKQIRNSSQGMLAKNRYFQEVLNEYAHLSNPVAAVQSSTGSVQSSTGSVLGAPIIAGETEASDQ
jgi:hypothetical protein